MGKATWRTLRGKRQTPRRRARSLVALARLRLARRLAARAARRAARGVCKTPGETPETRGDTARAPLLAGFPEGFVHRFRRAVHHSRALETRCPSP